MRTPVPRRAVTFTADRGCQLALTSTADNKALPSRAWGLQIKVSPFDLLDERLDLMVLLVAIGSVIGLDRFPVRPCTWDHPWSASRSSGSPSSVPCCHLKVYSQLMQRTIGAQSFHAVPLVPFRPGMTLCSLGTEACQGGRSSQGLGVQHNPRMMP